jgi:hypothetical protein
VLADVVVADAHNAQPSSEENTISFGIVIGLCQMPGAVDLDNQVRSGAEEIDHKSVDDLLAAKRLASQPVVTQIMLERRLLRGHIPPEFPRTANLLWIHGLPEDDPRTTSWPEHALTALVVSLHDRLPFLDLRFGRAPTRINHRGPNRIPSPERGG